MRNPNGDWLKRAHEIHKLHEASDDPVIKATLGRIEEEFLCLHRYSTHDGILDMPINNLHNIGKDFPVRFKNYCHSYTIGKWGPDQFVTLRDVLRLTERELRFTPNIGAKTIREVKEALASYGLTLNMGEWP